MWWNKSYWFKARHCPNNECVIPMRYWHRALKPTHPQESRAYDRNLTLLLAYRNEMNPKKTSHSNHPNNPKNSEANIKHLLLLNHPKDLCHTFASSEVSRYRRKLLQISKHRIPLGGLQIGLLITVSSSVLPNGFIVTTATTVVEEPCTGALVVHICQG